jgi:hypothetical protein
MHANSTTIAPAGFECYKKFRKDLGFEETITYGNGILLLFYGTPRGSPDLFLHCHRKQVSFIYKLLSLLCLYF